MTTGKHYMNTVFVACQVDGVDLLKLFFAALLASWRNLIDADASEDLSRIA